MIPEKILKRLSGAALFVMGAVSASLILFISNNEKTVSFFLGALFGIGLLIAGSYLVRHWLTFQGTNSKKNKTDGSILIQTISRIISEKSEMQITATEVERLSKKVINIGAVILSSWSMIGIFAIVFSVALYSATLLQVRKVEDQNKLITVQNNLAEASRRSSLIFLFGNVMDRISEELKHEDNKERNLSTELVGRIAALAQAFKPYRFIEDGELIDKPLSPERGQIVVALYNSELSEQSYFAIFNRTNLSNADLRDATLHTANLSESKMINANFSGANLILSNLQQGDFTKANFQNARLDKSVVSLANMTEADLRFASLRGVGDNFLGVHMVGANLSHAEITKDDWDKLLKNSAAETREYLATSYRLSMNQSNDVSGKFFLIEALEHKN